MTDKNKETVGSFSVETLLHEKPIKYQAENGHNWLKQTVRVYNSFAERELASSQQLRTLEDENNQSIVQAFEHHFDQGKTIKKKPKNKNRSPTELKYEERNQFTRQKDKMPKTFHTLLALYELIHTCSEGRGQLANILTESAKAMDQVVVQHRVELIECYNEMAKDRKVLDDLLAITVKCNAKCKSLAEIRDAKGIKKIKQLTKMNLGDKLAQATHEYQESVEQYNFAKQKYETVLLPKNMNRLEFLERRRLQTMHLHFKFVSDMLYNNYMQYTKKFEAFRNASTELNVDEEINSFVKDTCRNYGLGSIDVFPPDLIDESYAWGAKPRHNAKVLPNKNLTLHPDMFTTPAVDFKNDFSLQNQMKVQKEKFPMLIIPIPKPLKVLVDYLVKHKVHEEIKLLDASIVEPLFVEMISWKPIKLENPTIAANLLVMYLEYIPDTLIASHYFSTAERRAQAKEAMRREYISIWNMMGASTPLKYEVLAYIFEKLGSHPRVLQRITPSLIPEYHESHIEDKAFYERFIVSLGDIAVHYEEYSKSLQDEVFEDEAKEQSPEVAEVAEVENKPDYSKSLPKRPARPYSYGKPKPNLAAKPRIPSKPSSLKGVSIIRPNIERK